MQYMRNKYCVDNRLSIESAIIFSSSNLVCSTGVTTYHLHLAVILLKCSVVWCSMILPNLPTKWCNAIVEVCLWKHFRGNAFVKHYNRAGYCASIS